MSKRISYSGLFQVVPGCSGLCQVVPTGWLIDLEKQLTGNMRFCLRCTKKRIAIGYPEYDDDNLFGLRINILFWLLFLLPLDCIVFVHKKAADLKR